MHTKKAAIMIYPFFSLQEVTCLTSYLSLYLDYTIDVYASTTEPVPSEDNFQVVANKLFHEFTAADYDCLILPGIVNPIPALHNPANANFLQSLAGQDIIIGSISSSPLLLAQAGLLADKTFTSGVFDEMLQWFDFVPTQNIVHTPVHTDGSMVTAIGFAFREFAVAVLRAMGHECKDNIFPPISREYTAEELTFRMGAGNFKAFTDEYLAYPSAE